MNATTVVHVGRGSIVVERPPKELLVELRRFHRMEDGSGLYEELYSLSMSGDTLVTMPGFADRVKRICGRMKVLDERVPMPDPDIDAALNGIDTAWHEVVRKAIASEGGVVAVPEILGFEQIAAAILRAYKRDELVERGTPLSMIAARDREAARRITLALRALLPERDIGMASSGSYTDSDDVIVVPYGVMDDVPCHLAGVFIGDDIPGMDFVGRAEAISSIRNAGRWGVYVTSAGGCPGIDMAVEGLFGPVSVQATYADAVNAGIGVPITVCWLECPRPKCSLGSAPFNVLEATAMQRNAAFVETVSRIVEGVSPDVGCLVCTDPPAMMRLVSKIPGVVEVSRNITAKERRLRLDEIASGTIRKAVVSYGAFPLETDHGVMVVATCGGGDVAGWRIPWRRLSRQGERTYLVDFSHPWDYHNGRPGRLARNDDARVRRYREMGFSQIVVEDAGHLPFLGR